MHRSWLIASMATGVALTGAMLVLAGCGGGGGPITPPPDPDPGVSAEFLALLPAGQKGASYIGSANCKNCHEAGVDGAPKVDFTGFAATKHSQIGVGCEQCHGPSSNHQAAPSEDNILTHPSLSNAAVCGQCHGPMASDFKNSPHAHIVEDAVAGASKTCLRCHSAAMRADQIDAKLTAGATADEIDAAITALSTEKMAEYKESTEASHETASCANCHDPMKATTNMMWSNGKQAHLRYAETNADTTQVAPGALVKAYTTYNHSCANCHNGRGGNNTDAVLNTSTARPTYHDSNQYNMLMGFAGSELPNAPVVRQTAHASAAGQCAHCHMPNSKHTMTAAFDVSCAPCHTPGDAAARYAIRGAIEAQLVTLRTRLQNWSRTKFGDPDLWDYTSLVPVGKTAPSQTLVPIEVKRARHNYYFVLRDGSFGVHNSVYTRYLLTQANLNLDNIGATKMSGVKLSPAQIKSVLQFDAKKGRNSGAGEL